MSDFTQEKYEEFVGLYQDPNEGHNTLMGIGQQMMTNTDLARRLRVNFKSANGAAGASAAEGSGASDGSDDSQVDMEFFLTAMHDEIQKDPALASRLGLVSAKADDDGDFDGDDDSDVAEIVPDDATSFKEGGPEPEPAAVSGFKQKAAALIDEVFGRKESGTAGEVGYDEYDEDPFDDDEDVLTLSASDVGDGVGIEDQFGAGAFRQGEKGADLRQFAAVVSREAAKAAGGAASRQVAKQMGEQMDSLKGLIGSLVGRLEEMDAANERQAKMTDQQLSSVKEAVAGLRSQYELLDEQLPPMANFDRLRVDKGLSGWGAKDDGSDGEYDDYDDDGYDDAFDGAFVDPLVQSTFGVTNSW